MKGISRRARTCAVAAAAGALALTGTAFAQAPRRRRPATVCRPARASIQLFTHSGYISNGPAGTVGAAAAGA